MRTIVIQDKHAARKVQVQQKPVKELAQKTLTKNHVKMLKKQGIYKFKVFYIDFAQKKMKCKICTDDEWVDWRDEDA